MKINLDDISEKDSRLFISPPSPKYQCPVHGEINETLCFHPDEEKEVIFCIRCWRDFLLQHLPEVTKINRVEVVE